ncbi:uncharacterized protein LOC141721876 [Apium graveolens]|uniref:uncharacterized protein LOC141721876 n=1 Tax=Apium graveolens TaxID=4045 RepID=UPI003D7BF774
MSTNNGDIFGLRFTGKLYSNWEFQFRLFVTGKELWGHVDGSESAPTDAAKLAEWKVKDARVMSWIISTLSIQEYYSGFQNLWAEFTDIAYAKVPAASLLSVQQVHEQSKRDQFLMKLRPEFEVTRSNLMNRASSPSLDECFSELLREEQCLATQSAIQQTSMPDQAIAYAAQGRGKGRNMQQVQCYSCKEYGHIAANCAKKFCNYCKKPGHTIKECRTRPQNRQSNVGQAAIGNQAVVGSVTAEKSTLTPEMVQQMIVSAFSALGLQGSGIGDDPCERA